jgi:hypothetical protein
MATQAACQELFAMPAHPWTFKSRFRAKTYGWRGTALATKRLKEAVTEIKRVAKTDPITAADGVVSLMERIWPALQGIDGSSGALGGAVNRTLHALLPILINAPADNKTRSKWLDRLYDAVVEDGVEYLSPVEDQWGSICGDQELANHWADRLLPLLRQSWARSEWSSSVKGDSLCLSSLVRAERYEELQQLLALRSRPFWPFDKFWARALVQQGRIDEALALAESHLRERPNYGYGDIVRFCEQTLLDAGRVEEAYRRFARAATHSMTNVGAFRQVVEKYPERDPRSILLDFVAAYTEKGKWFAAAKEAGCLDVALTCAADRSADPATLLRAARDYVVKDAFFAAQVALCALRNLLAGGGYEPTTMDVVHAYAARATYNHRA